MTLGRKREQTVKGHFFFYAFLQVSAFLRSSAVALRKLDQNRAAQSDQNRCEYVFARGAIIEIGKRGRLGSHAQIGGYEHGGGEQDRRECDP